MAEILNLIGNTALVEIYNKAHAMFVINYWDFLVFSFSWHTNGLEAGGEHRQQTFSPQREYEPSSYDCMNKQNQPNKKKPYPEHYPQEPDPQQDYKVLHSEKFGIEAEKFPAKVLHPNSSGR